MRKLLPFLLASAALAQGPQILAKQSYVQAQVQAAQTAQSQALAIQAATQSSALNSETTARTNAVSAAIVTARTGSQSDSQVYNAITQGGAAGNAVLNTSTNQWVGTDDTSALNSAAAAAKLAGKCLFIPGRHAYLVTTWTAYAPMCIFGEAQSTAIVSNSKTANVVHLLGTGTTQQSNGIFRDITIVGGQTGTLLAPNGQVAVLVDAITQLKLYDLTIYGTDAGIRTINNCFGLLVDNARIGFGQGNHIGIDLPSNNPDSQSGNQITIQNSWIAGDRGCLSIGAGNDGISLLGTQCGLANSTTTDYGGINFGVNYADGTYGDMGTLLISHVDFEGDAGWFLRGHGAVTLIAESNNFYSYPGVPSAGILKSELQNVSTFSFHGNTWGGSGGFTAAQPVIFSGDNGSTTYVSDTWNGYPLSINGTAYNNVGGSDPFEISNRLAGSVNLWGVSTFRPASSNRTVIYRDGLYTRYSGGHVQSSTNGSTWVNGLP